MQHEGVIVKMLPGGGGGMGIAVFDGDVPPSHVTTMLRFDAWTYLPNGPTAPALPPPCTCVTMDGGVILSTGCAAHDAAGATRVASDSPATFTIGGHKFVGWIRNRPARMSP